MCGLPLLDYYSFRKVGRRQSAEAARLCTSAHGHAQQSALLRAAGLETANANELPQSVYCETPGGHISSVCQLGDPKDAPVTWATGPGCPNSGDPAWLNRGRP